MTTGSTNFSMSSAADIVTGKSAHRRRRSSEHFQGDRSMSKVWFITGAGRGMGVDIAKAALAAGHKVVATGRNTDKVAKALGKSADLLVVKLDITKPADADSAIEAAIARFGRIDV